MVSDLLFLSIVAMAMSMRLTSTPSQVEMVKCTKGSDCPADKCCVSYPVMGGGICQPMLKISEDCNTLQPYAWTRPVEMVTEFDRCPCEPGDFCASLDGGEWGICTFG